MNTTSEQASAVEEFTPEEKRELLRKVQEIASPFYATLDTEKLDPRYCAYALEFMTMLYKVFEHDHKALAYVSNENIYIAPYAHMCIEKKEGKRFKDVEKPETITVEVKERIMTLLREVWPGTEAMDRLVEELKAS